MINEPQLIFPDYQHSNLTIISAILDHYGICPQTPPSTDVAERFKRDKPRNVVFILMDAMGSAILERHLPPESFLRSHLIKDLVAVYPCTTVCVTSSMFSGLPPLSHAWLAWALYFKEWNRAIEVYPYRDTYTGEAIDLKAQNFLNFMDFESIFSKIERQTENVVEVDCIFTEIARPRLVQLAGKRLHKAASFDSMLKQINEKCAEPGSHFIIGYWKSPDDLLHVNGLMDEKVSAFMTAADTVLEEWLPQLSDASVVISADHGMQQMSHHFLLNQYPHLTELLRNVPAGDSRAKALYVKTGSEDLFASRFEREFGAEFLLLSQEEVIRRQFLGDGEIHPRTRDFIGDFLAMGIGTSDLLYSLPTRQATLFQGHHAGLTPEEMRVPLILYS